MHFESQLHAERMRTIVWQLQSHRHKGAHNLDALMALWQGACGAVGALSGH